MYDTPGSLNRLREVTALIPFVGIREQPSPGIVEPAADGIGTATDVLSRRMGKQHG